MHCKLCFYFKDAKDGTYKVIGDSLRANPENVMFKFDRDQVEKKMLTGRYANIHVHNIQIKEIRNILFMILF